MIKDPSVLDVNAPLGCHLQFIGGTDIDLAKAKAEFLAACVRGHGRGAYSGAYFTALLCIVNKDTKHLGKIVKVLEEAKFKVLAHNDESVLYGRGFKEA